MHLPVEVQAQLIEKGIEFYVVDAHSLAHDVGLGGRINTIMQPCFFHLWGVMPQSEVVPHVKQAIEKAYAKRGSAVVERNFAAVDRALESLYKVQVPSAPSGDLHRMPPPPSHAPDFVRPRDCPSPRRRGRPAPRERPTG